VDYNKIEVSMRRIRICKAAPSQAELCERARLLEAIDIGLADEGAGRVVSHAAVVAELKRRTAKSSSKR
jgi:predicted transcriptional regulator